MSPARIVHRLGLLGLLAVAPQRLEAQVSGIELTCGNPDRIDLAQLDLPESDPLRSLHPVVARARLGPLVDAERWREAADSLASWFRQSRPEEPQPGDSTTLLAQLDTLSLLLAGGHAESLRGADVLLAPGSRVDFDPQPTSGAYRILFASPAEITITPEDPEAVQRAFCWTAYSASDLLGRYRRPAFHSLQRRIRTALALWEAYNETGRSQYPWELWLNGLGSDPRELHPPRTQAILLHPWIGVEAVGIDKASLDDLGPVTRATVVPLDLIGLIRYDETYTRYWGASLTLSLGEDRTRGGVALHLSNGVSVGPTWAKLGAPNGLMLSVDFYPLLAGLPQVQRAVEEKLRAASVVTPGS